MLKKVWCFIKGHDMIEEARIDNGTSQWGNHKCLRCGIQNHWQYDYIVP